MADTNTEMTKEIEEYNAFMNDIELAKMSRRIENGELSEEEQKEYDAFVKIFTSNK